MIDIVACQKLPAHLLMIQGNDPLYATVQQCVICSVTEQLSILTIFFLFYLLFLHPNPRVILLCKYLILRTVFCVTQPLPLPVQSLWSVLTIMVSTTATSCAVVVVCVVYHEEIFLSSNFILILNSYTMMMNFQSRALSGAILILCPALRHITKPSLNYI